MSAARGEIDFLFLTGDKVSLPLDDEFYASCGFQTNPQEVRIGDLRQFLWDKWDTLISKRESHGSESLDNITKRPQHVEQIQMLHLGRRLDPNELLNGLDLSVSHYIHIMIKPELPLQSGKFERLATQLKTKTNRRGSTSNDPVPVFVRPAAPEAEGSGATGTHGTAGATGAATPTDKSSIDRSQSPSIHQQPATNTPPTTPAHDKQAGCCVIV